MTLQRFAAYGAVALLALGLVPYFPHHDYERRYLLLAFANELPSGEFWFTARDEATGRVDLWYDFETRERPEPLAAHNFELFVGAWGPSHGVPPRLANGYPAPYLEERPVRVEGGPFAVRVWEGAGVQKDCKAVFASLDLTPHRTTGGGQGWPSHPPAHRTPGGAHLGAPYRDAWGQTQWLTCAWIEFTGEMEGPGLSPVGYATAAA